MKSTNSPKSVDMKKNIVLYFIKINGVILISVITVGVLFSQELTTSIYFEDAAGNKDTITVGYDPKATYDLDTILGEVDIKKETPKSGLDVRIVSELEYPIGEPRGPKMKYSLYPGSCDPEDSEFTKIQLPYPIEVITDHWPIWVRVDSIDFSDYCIQNSFFTDLPFNHWFYVGGCNTIAPYDSIAVDGTIYGTDLTEFRLRDEFQVIAYDSACYSHIEEHRPSLHYINGEGRAVSKYFISLRSQNVFLGNDDKFLTEDGVRMQYNPTSHVLSVIQDDNLKEAQLKIINLNGQILMTEDLSADKRQDITLPPRLTPGLYIAHWQSKKGRKVKKFVID